MPTELEDPGPQLRPGELLDRALLAQPACGPAEIIPYHLPDSATPNRLAPNSDEHLTLGRAVDLFLAAEAVEGPRPRPSDMDRAPQGQDCSP
jgi:hypothetical protein